MTLSTLLDLEKYLQADFTNNSDAAVLLLLDYAQAVVETYCDRTFEAATGVAETLDGRGDAILFLSQWPVTAITSVTENGTILTGGDTMYFSYPDGRLYRGTPEAEGGLRWSRGRRNVVVTYDHGYAVIPDALAMASTRIAGRIFQASEAYANAPIGASGIKSIALDGSDAIEYTAMIADVTLGLDSLRDIDKTLLAAYKRVVL